MLLTYQLSKRLYKELTEKYSACASYHQQEDVEYDKYARLTRVHHKSGQKQKNLLWNSEKIAFNFHGWSMLTDVDKFRLNCSRVKCQAEALNKNWSQGWRQELKESFHRAVITCWVLVTHIRMKFYKTIHFKYGSAYKSRSSKVSGCMFHDRN